MRNQSQQITANAEQLRGHTYNVSGMHCASCEILVEKRLLEEKGVEAVEASINKDRVHIEYLGSKPTIKKLNKIFKKNGYTFSEKAVRSSDEQPLIKIGPHGQFIVNKKSLKNLLLVAGFSLLIILGFLGLNKTGFVALLSVNNNSSLPAFLIFGLLAGFSTCAALVGGIVLSMSKQWAEIYATKDSTWEKLQPHFLFNLGRWELRW